MRTACQERPALFDSIDPADHAEAARYCLGDDDTPPCPFLAACREAHAQALAASHASARPEGTWAGELHRTQRGSPREHGSERGYGQHRYHHEEACEPCKAAHSLVEQIRRARRTKGAA